MTARDELPALKDDDNRTWIGAPIPEPSPEVAELTDIIARALRMDDAVVEHVADAIIEAGWVKPLGPCPECQGLPGTNVRQHKYWCKTVEGIVQHGQVYD